MEMINDGCQSGADCGRRGIGFRLGLCLFFRMWPAQNQHKNGPMMVPMALEALYLLLLSWLIAVFYMLQMDHSMVRGIGAIFSATVIIGYFSSAAWSQRPMKLAGLNSGYFIGCIVILLLTNYVGRMM